MKHITLEHIINVALALSLALFIIICGYGIYKYSTKDDIHHPDFDWIGECGESRGYWYVTGQNFVKIKQDYMTELEFQKYCKGE